LLILDSHLKGWLFFDKSYQQRYFLNMICTICKRKTINEIVGIANVPEQKLKFKLNISGFTLDLTKPYFLSQI